MTALRECLFCESYKDLSVEGRKYRFIVCRNCGATGHYAQTDMLAQQVWNETPRAEKKEGKKNADVR